MCYCRETKWTIRISIGIKRFKRFSWCHSKLPVFSLSAQANSSSPYLSEERPRRRKGPLWGGKRLQKAQPEEASREAYGGAAYWPSICWISRRQERVYSKQQRLRGTHCSSDYSPDVLESFHNHVHCPQGHINIMARWTLVSECHSNDLKKEKWKTSAVSLKVKWSWLNGKHWGISSIIEIEQGEMESHRD